MQDPNSSNSQTQVAPPAPPAGPSLEDVSARLAELEKQSEGRLRDLQEERRKRQELEARLNSAPAPAPSPAQPDVTQDELGKVLNPYIAPLVSKVTAAEKELEGLRLEKAQNYLAQKTGKSWDSIESDKDFQEKLMSVSRRYGITGNVYERTQRAYELLELENLRAKEAERARAASAVSAGGMPQGNPPPPAAGKRQLSKDEFEKMSMVEYEKLSTDGSFVEDPETGKIVYSPK